MMICYYSISIEGKPRIIVNDKRDVFEAVLKMTRDENLAYSCERWASAPTLNLDDTLSLTKAGATTPSIVIRMLRAEDAEKPVQNTRIDYLYRDASNYKVPNTCVVEGVLSEEDINVIIRHLYDANTETGEGWFIPKMVGLDGERFSDETEDDHPFFELSRNGFSITEDTPDTAITARELVPAFLGAWAAGWGDEQAVHKPRFDGYIGEQISSLDAILSNDPGREYTAQQIAEMEYDLRKLESIQDLWEEFGNVPMNPETECIETKWRQFPAGTFREDVWHWFEARFDLSVAENLMGL